MRKNLHKIWNILLVLCLAYGLHVVEGQSDPMPCREYNQTVALSKLIIDYSVWRKLDQLNIIGFDDPSSGCSEISGLKIILAKNLNSKDTYVSFNEPNHLNYLIKIHRVGIIIPVRPTNIAWVIKKITFENSFHHGINWLFVVDAEYEMLFLSQLCKLRIRFDSDIIVAVTQINYINPKIAQLNANNVKLSTVFNGPNVQLPLMYSRFDKAPTFVKNMYNHDQVIGISVNYISEPVHGSEPPNYQINQLFKIRTEIDESCISNNLGGQGFSGFLAKRFINPEHRTNMYKFPIKVAGINYNIYDVNAENMTDEKYAMDSLTNYFLMLFNASLIKKEFDQYGENENGTWTGLFASIVSGESDIGIAAVVNKFDRAKYMSFTIPVVNTFRSIYFRQPDSSSIRDIYMTPFTPLLLGMVIAITFIIALMLKLSYHLTEDEELNWSDTILWCAGILFMQGTICDPNTLSTKAFAIVALLFGLIVFNAYSASITSTLSIQFEEIHSLADLFTTDFSIGYVSGGSDELFLNETDEKILIELKRRAMKRATNLVGNNLDGLLKALNSRHAHFGSQPSIRRSILRLQKAEQCEIYEVQVLEAGAQISFPMPFDSPYRKIIILSLLKMRETGVLSKIRRFILPDLPHCEDDVIFNSAKLSDVFTAFGMMLFIFGLSLFIMILENIWKRQRKFKIK